MKTSTIVIVLGLAAAGGVGFYLYKKSKAAPASSGNTFWSGVSDVLTGIGGIAESWGKQSSGHETDPANTTRIRSPLILTNAQRTGGIV